MTFDPAITAAFAAGFATGGFVIGGGIVAVLGAMRRAAIEDEDPEMSAAWAEYQRAHFPAPHTPAEEAQEGN